ncbi:MAG: hypothetical protein KDC98_00895, partial [Planctomycetes bacterium]|nr:hypothetical protein [Planctomycetota bacterium]
ARAILLERARAAGIATVERSLDLGDLHRAEAIAVSNAVYGPRAAGLHTGMAPQAAIVGSTLGRLWIAEVGAAIAPGSAGRQAAEGD